MADKPRLEKIDTNEQSFALEQLEPSPIDDGPADTYLPTPQPSTSGFLNHSLPYYLHRIQRYSSYTFSAFAALHITNTSLIPLYTRSLPESSRYLLLTRPYYQSALAEPLLVGIPLATHIVSGLLLRLHHRAVQLRRAGAESAADHRIVKWPPVSRIQALGLMADTVGPLTCECDTGTTTACHWR